MPPDNSGSQEVAISERTQEFRKLAIGTKLDDDVLLLRRATVVEQLGSPFQIQVDLFSETQDIDFKEIVGSNATIRFRQREDQPTRYFNGYVSRFVHTGGVARTAHYRMTLVPWLWFLTRTSNCRIFPDMKAPDILMKIFKEKGFNDYDMALKGTYNTRGYTVQYRETDFNFVQRLMEEEGIYYYWDHQDGKHVMVLADGYASHEPYPKFAKMPYHPHRPTHRTRDEEYIWEWVIEQEVQPGAYALTDFDPLDIKADMPKQKSIPREHAAADFEMYDYPGGYDSKVDGEAIAKIRIEEWQARHEIVRGRGDVTGLTVGYTFNLERFPRESQNAEHLVVSAVHTLESDEYNSTDGGDGGELPVHEVSFTAMLAATPFRPRRSTLKPVVHGPQTALVTGPSGEEIHTDKYGRVKVQFHWDRESKGDDTSSCWIRVAQSWAGKKWGSVFLPRVGHEVIVEFLEGDPDRPIVTGSVYNNVALPPYDLPAKKTVSTIKTDSSKGSGGFNEIKFEDEKGKEHLFIHAEKDEHLRVKNDSLTFVGQDRHRIVKRNEKVKVGGDDHRQVVGSQREKVGGDQEVIVVGEQLTKVTGKVHVKLEADRMAELTGDENMKVGGAMNLKVTGALSMDAGGSVFTKSGGDIGSDAKNVHLKGATNVVIEAGTALTIKAGPSFITLDSSGVMIVGSKVGVASGGSATAGAGCSPTAPTAVEAPDAPEDPTEAMDEKPGEKTEVKPPKPPKPVTYSAQAKVLKQAATDGTPFCEKCEEAKKKKEAQKRQQQQADSESSESESESAGGGGKKAEPALAGAGL